MSVVSRRLAFLDEPSRLAEVPPGFEPVALTPSVVLTGLRQGRDLLTVDAFLDDLELEELGDETYRRVDELCDGLDRLLARGGGATSRWRFQQLKTVFDGLLMVGLGAQRLARELGAREALVLVHPGSLAARALPPVLAAAGVDVRSAPAPEAPARAATAGLRSRLASLRTGLRRKLDHRSPRILCLDMAYSLPAIVEALRARGSHPHLWLPPPTKPSIVPAADLSGLASLFTLAGLDLWPAVQERLRALVQHEIPSDDEALKAAAAAIRRDRPDVLLASSFASPVAKAAAHAARGAGVPSVAARHGELGMQLMPGMRFNDLDVVDWMLCWGEWEARWAARHGRGVARSVVVGAPLIEEADAAPARSELRRRLRLDDDDVVVVYAPGALEGDDWFAGKRGPQDLSHVRHQVAVLEGLLATKGLAVVVKEHPQWGGRGPLHEWASVTGAPATFFEGLRFTEAARLADAVVLDFASTTLVQALHAGRRIYVVHHPVTVWEPGVVEHLERNAVRVVAPADLRAVLVDDLASGALRNPVAYPPGAIQPLLASGPGTAAERAADAVLAIAAGESPV